MTEETKKLFDAPWRTANSDYVKDADDHFVCEAETHEHAERIARLPELYDALKQATEDVCWKCSSEKNIFVPCCDPHANECYVAEWRELLRKVRNG